MKKNNKKGCLGYYSPSSYGNEFDCEYGTIINCEDCKYGGHGGRKDPEAKKNQLKG